INSFRGRKLFINGIVAFCNTSSTYLLLLTLPSSLIRGPSSFQVKHAQTITPPPPCLTVGTTQSTLYLSFGNLQTRILPSFLNKVNLDSSLHTTFFQSSNDQSRFSLAQARRSLIFLLLNKGLCTAIRLLYPISRNLRLIVDLLTTIPLDSTKFSRITLSGCLQSLFTIRFNCLSSLSVNKQGLPLRFATVVALFSLYLAMTVCTVFLERPNLSPIASSVTPKLLAPMIKPRSKSVNSDPLVILTNCV